MQISKAIVVLSGGQDSTTCLYWALKKYGRENVAALGFDYGQRHKLELKLAEKICKKESVPFEILDMSLLGQLAPNALTRNEMEVDCSTYENAYPNTFVDGRNHLFLSFAAVYAKQKGITDIITGVCQTDFSGYPDCRDIFIKSLNTTLNLAMDYDFQILTPLMWLNKAQTWAMAEKLECIDIIREDTLTCYNGIPGEGCTTCPACTLRRKGYEDYLRGKSDDTSGIDPYDTACI